MLLYRLSSRCRAQAHHCITLEYPASIDPWAPTKRALELLATDENTTNVEECPSYRRFGHSYAPSGRAGAAESSWASTSQHHILDQSVLPESCNSSQKPWSRRPRRLLRSKRRFECLSSLT